jgi:hypothetical protein
MRALAIVILLSSVAHAESWHPRLGTLLQVPPYWQGGIEHGWAGIVTGIERERGGFLVGGELVAMFSREKHRDTTMQEGPLESAFLVGPTASYRLGRTDPDQDGFFMEGRARASVDIGRMQTDGLAAWGCVARIALEGRIGDDDGSFTVGMGYAYGVGGDSTHMTKLALGGVDVAMSWSFGF